jgi:hypothetical protein
LDTVSVLSEGGSVFVGPVTLSLRPTAAAAASPAGGTYTSVQTVTLSSRTAGAFIRYTTDGSTPTPTTGTPYAGPITINRNTTLKAIAYAAGSTPSSVTTANYTIILPAVAPVFTPSGGSYRSAQNVAISSSTPGSSIRYTTDESVPTAATGIPYTGPINVSGTTVLKAVAFAPGYSASAVSTAAYVISDLPQSFVNLPLPGAQSDVFKLEFDATPSGSDSIVGLSLGAQTDSDGLAAALSFNPAGLIQARNGDNFAAAAPVAYVPGTKYRVRFVVDLTTRTYSAYVTPEGGVAQLIGKYFAFGGAQALIAALDNLGVATTSGPDEIGPLSLTATTEPDRSPRVRHRASRWRSSRRPRNWATWARSISCPQRGRPAGPRNSAPTASSGSASAAKRQVRAPMSPPQTCTPPAIVCTSRAPSRAAPR